METFTHTKIDLWRNCRQKFYYRCKKFLVPPSEPAYFRFGRIIHLALADWHIRNRMENPQERRDETLTSLDREYGAEIEQLKRNIFFQEEIDELEFEREIAKTMIKGYMEKYPEEDFEVLVVERKFEVPILHPDGRTCQHTQFAGVIDAILLWNGKLWLMENKTAKNINGSYLHRLQLDTQISGYVYGAEVTLGEPIHGILYNILPKSQLRLKQNETPDSLLQRIKEDYQGKLQFVRHEVYRNPYDLQRFQYELWAIAQEHWWMRNASKEFYYRNPSQCGFPSSGATCPYFDLCIEDTAEMRHIFRIEHEIKELQNVQLLNRNILEGVNHHEASSSNDDT